MNRIDVDKIKEQITSEYIKEIMATFNCYPKSENNENIIFPSICHHPQDDGFSRKSRKITKLKESEDSQN